MSRLNPLALNNMGIILAKSFHHTKAREQVQSIPYDTPHAVKREAVKSLNSLYGRLTDTHLWAISLA